MSPWKLAGFGRYVAEAWGWGKQGPGKMAKTNISLVVGNTMHRFGHFALQISTKLGMNT